MFNMENALVRFLEEQLRRRGWSGRAFSGYAQVSNDTVARTLRGESIPEPDTIRKFARALEVDESYLLRLAGHLEETPAGLNDPGVIALAYRLEDLPPDMRLRAMQAMDAMLEMAGPVSLSEIDRQSRIAELKRAIREAQRYLESLEQNKDEDGDY